MKKIFISILFCSLSLISFGQSLHIAYTDSTNNLYSCGASQPFVIETSYNNFITTDAFLILKLVDGVEIDTLYSLLRNNAVVSIGKSNKGYVYKLHDLGQLNTNDEIQIDFKTFASCATISASGSYNLLDSAYLVFDTLISNTGDDFTSVSYEVLSD